MISSKLASKFTSRSIRLPDGSSYKCEKKIKAHSESDCLDVAAYLGCQNDWYLFFISKTEDELCLLPSCFPLSVDHLHGKITRLYFLFFLCDMCATKRIQPQNSQDLSDINVINDIIVTNRNGLKTSSDDRLASRAILDSDEAVNRLLSTLLSIPSLTTETFSVKDHSGTAYDLDLSCDCMVLKPKFNANHSVKIPWNLLGDARSVKSFVLIPYCGSVDPASPLVSFIKHSRPKRSLSCHRGSHQLHSAHGVERADPSSDNTYINFISTDALTAERLAYRLRATRAYILRLKLDAGETNPSERRIQRSASFSNFNRQLRHTLRRISLPFVKKLKTKERPSAPDHRNLDGAGDMSLASAEFIDAAPVSSSTCPQSTLVKVDGDRPFLSDSLDSCPLGYRNQIFTTHSIAPLHASATPIAAGEAEAELDVSMDPLLRPVLNAPSLSLMGPTTVEITAVENSLSSFVANTAPEPTYSMGIKAIGMPPFSALPTRFTTSGDTLPISSLPIGACDSSPISLRPNAKEDATFHHAPSNRSSTDFNDTQPCPLQVNNDLRLKPVIPAESQEQTPAHATNNYVTSLADDFNSAAKDNQRWEDTKPISVSVEVTQLGLNYGQPTSSSVTVSCTVPQIASTEEPLKPSGPLVTPTFSSTTPAPTFSAVSQDKPLSVKPTDKPFTSNLPHETTISSSEFTPKVAHTARNGAPNARDSQVTPGTETLNTPPEATSVTQSKQLLSDATPGITVTVESPQKATFGSRIKPPSIQPRVSSNTFDVLARTPEFPVPYVPANQHAPSASDTTGLPEPKMLYQTRSGQMANQSDTMAHASSSIKFSRQSPAGPLVTSSKSGTPPTPVRSTSTVTSVSPAHPESALHTVHCAHMSSRIRPPSIDPGPRFRTTVTDNDFKDVTSCASNQPTNPNSTSAYPNNALPSRNIPQPTPLPSLEGNISITTSFGSHLRHPMPTPSSGIRPPAVRLPAPGIPSKSSTHSSLGTSQAPVVQGANVGAYTPTMIDCTH
ncbi:unnamed protein product [Dicrocoelium dendriticum]|nr:unnamed protein product [Dicrocoelium dendriticum]